MPALLILLLVTSLVGGGTACASQDALPGDILYGVKMLVEDARLLINADEIGDAELHLEFATERLEEAATLVAQGRPDFVEDLVTEYAEEMEGALAPLADGVDDEEMDLHVGLGEALDHHYTVLASVLEQVPEEAQPAIEQAMADSDLADEVDEDDDAFVNCTGVDPHPVGEGLAARYGVAYEEIMTWFCDGFGFGEIVLAYSISQQANIDIEVDDLFALREEEGRGWGEIMQELGLIGRPDDVGPQADAGPPVDIEPPPVDIEPPPVDIEPPPVDIEPPPVDVEPPSVDIEPPPVDVEPPPVDVEPPPLDVEPPTEIPGPPGETPGPP